MTAEQKRERYVLLHESAHYVIYMKIREKNKDYLPKPISIEINGTGLKSSGRFNHGITKLKKSLHKDFILMLLAGNAAQCVFDRECPKLVFSKMKESSDYKRAFLLSEKKDEKELFVAFCEAISNVKSYRAEIFDLAMILLRERKIFF